MKAHIESLLFQAIEVLAAQGTVDSDQPPAFSLTPGRSREHGDFACNLALVLASSSRLSARDLAAAVVAALPACSRIDRVEVAGAGFINFYLTQSEHAGTVATILAQGRAFGLSNQGRGDRVLVSTCLDPGVFGSELHLARIVLSGSVIANLLEAIGFTVIREWLIEPDDRHNGDLAHDPSSLLASAADLLPPASRCDRLMLFEETPQHARGRVQGAGSLKRFVSPQGGDIHTHAGDGAACASGECFAASGVANEQANTRNDWPLQEPCLRAVYVSGADTRLAERCQAVRQCEDLAHQAVVFIPVQGAAVSQADAVAGLSTRLRAGELTEWLLDEAGHDLIRFTFAMRKLTHRLYFDLTLANRRDRHNPLYSVQLAYSLTCSISRQFRHKGMDTDMAAGVAASHRLSESDECRLLALLAHYPELIRRSAEAHNPQRVTRYLRDLADGLHRYYSAHKVFVEDGELRQARWCLLMAVRQVLGNGLALLNVSTPEVM